MSDLKQLVHRWVTIWQPVITTNKKHIETYINLEPPIQTAKGTNLNFWLFT